MVTSKERFSEYLKKAQTFQSMALGTADINISITSVLGGECSITVYVYPLDEDCRYIPDTKKKDSYIYYKFSFSEWELMEENEKSLKEMLNLQREMLDL